MYTTEEIIYLLNDKEPPKANPWNTALFFILLLILCVLAYTYTVIGTLTAVESLQQRSTIKSNADSIETHPVRQFRWTWRFRGWTTALLIRGVKIALFCIPERLRMTLPMDCLYTTTIDLLLSSLYVVLIQTTIAQPVSRPFHRRVPGWRAWLQIAPAACLASLARSANFFVPIRFLQSTSFGTVHVVGVILSSTGIYFLVSAPLQAVFTRAAASILSEQDCPVIPLDERLRGKNGIGILDAWKSWDGTSRARYFNALGRAFLLRAVVWICLVWWNLSAYNPVSLEVIWAAV
ncbi:hypothetical protein ASPZODRAFT_143676 [Penicilliopsis zonata CBS 506.65]|uniref:Uncharacterized protein n=1 Tax=Penicilliopsis zonata CBS 506.65 TaxID=1073090 RepID=A0A1L9SFE4_9EURO|nr:hypothetical protein ASPZODRAFT_143676 [Penicilliopsis zonata CBS 506.65]OJJ45797.1 hypothetical protein ASPZODRAFT_143676 [Penicilliopsis zonata CBS 506.65]